MKYFIIKLLTNTKGQDGSKIEAVYTDKEMALYGYHNLCATLHHASDVLYAVVKLENEYGNSEIMEVVDHRPVPTPEPEVETETPENLT